jgi:hypothetical protein
MQSTLTGRPTPYRPHLRALHFSLLFGASGGVARTDSLPMAFVSPNRPDAKISRRLVPDRDLARLNGDKHPGIDGGATLVCRAEGEE